MYIRKWDAAFNPGSCRSCLGKSELVRGVAKLRSFEITLSDQITALICRHSPQRHALDAPDDSY